MMIKLSVVCMVVNLILGVLSYFTLKVHGWEFVVAVGALNLVCFLLEWVSLLLKKDRHWA